MLSNWLRIAGVGLMALSGLYVLPAQGSLVAATLPSSRSVAVGETATFFATIINAGTEQAEGCQIGLASSIDATLFYQTTDPATNALTGSQNTPVNIATGASQSFVVGVNPGSPFNPQDVAFEFSCINQAAAPSFPGLNTLLLSASETPVLDVVAIALTPSGDGIAQLPKESALGFLSLATINLGAAGDVNVRARTPDGVRGALLVCETDPTNGACLLPPAARVDLNIPENGTPTFAVFASSELALPLDPAQRRLFIEFLDNDSVVRGSTSVALAGGGPDIETRLAPDANGITTLPDEQASAQVTWLLEQLSEADTTIAEINQHFGVGSALDWQRFLTQLRNEGYSGARVLDLLWATPVSVGFVLGTGEPGAPRGFTQVRAQYAGDGLITFFRVDTTGDTVQFARDQNLTMAQAADDFIATGAENSLVVARISNGQCEPILGRNAATPRALASVFKIWVLGGVAQAINEGVLSLDQTIPLQQRLFAQGGQLNSEPLGTPITMQDMATMMMGISDNTATDHLHDLAGRSRMDATVSAFGHATPDLMLPLLNISQHFSLFFSFPLNDSLSYINGTEAEQNEFLTNRIIPIGSVLGGPFANGEVIADAFVQASPLDTCQTFAALRGFDRNSDGFDLIDRALGSAAAQPNIRPFWDRVWYKGGNLIDFTNNQRVLTHAWFLESAEHGQFAVVAFANNRVSGNIDTFDVQSLTSRILQLLQESL